MTPSNHRPTPRCPLALRVPLVLSLVLGLLVAQAPLVPVQAQSPGAEAKAAFRAGQQQFKAKEYEQALQSFLRAYELKPHPDILFMVGQSHRNLKHYTKAIKAFEGYLEAKPMAEDKADVQRLIEELQFLREVSPEEEQDEVKELDPAATEPKEDEDKKPLATPVAPVVPPSPAPAKRKTPVYKKWWFWTIVVGAAAAAGVGGYFIATEAGPTNVPQGSLGTLDLR